MKQKILTCKEIYFRFFRLGAFTIGGGIVMLGVIESELRALKIFSDEEISDMIVLATAVPGPIATNLSYVAGRAMGGTFGAVAAVLGTATAPFLTILLLSGIIIANLSNPYLNAFFAGAGAGVAVVVWNSLYKMIKNSASGVINFIAFIITALSVTFLGVHPFLALAIGGIISGLGMYLKK